MEYSRLMTDGEEDEDGDSDWYVRNKKFGSNFNVLLPAGIRDQVSFYSEAYGRSVNWYYETEIGIGAVSNSELEGSSFVDMGSSQVHDDGNIVMPKQLRENFSRPIYEDLEMAFVASDGMLEGEKRSVYIITKSQENDMLQDREGAEGLRDVISDTPGFFPTPY